MKNEDHLSSRIARPVELQPVFAIDQQHHPHRDVSQKFATDSGQAASKSKCKSAERTLFCINHQQQQEPTTRMGSSDHNKQNDHDSSECRKAEQKDSSVSRRGDDSMASCAAAGREHKIGRAPRPDTDRYHRLSLRLAIVVVAAAVPLGDNKSNTSKVANVFTRSCGDTERKIASSCYDTKTNIWTSERRCADNDKSHHYLTAGAMLLLALCGGGSPIATLALSVAPHLGRQAIHKSKGTSTALPLLLMILTMGARVQSSAAPHRWQQQQQQLQPESADANPMVTFDPMHNPYLVVLSNSSSGYLERHNFGPRKARLSSAGDQQADDGATSQQQGLLAMPGVAGDSSMQQVLANKGAANSSSRRSADPGGRIVVGKNRNRLVRQLNEDIHGVGHMVANSTPAAGWLLAGDNGSDDKDNHPAGVSGSSAPTMISQDQPVFLVAASAGGAYAGGHNYTLGGNDGTAADNKNHTNDYGKHIKRDYETTRLSTGAGGGGRLLGAVASPIAATRRDFITSFLSQLPGLASFRASTGLIQRQPMTQQSSAGSSLAAKLAARLRPQPSAANSSSSTTALNHHRLPTSTNNSKLVEIHGPANSYNLISSNDTDLSNVAGNWPPGDHQLVSGGHVASNSSAHDQPIADWLSVQASDNIEQVIHAAGSSDVSSQSSRKTEQDEKARLGESLNGHEQEGHWKREKHGHEERAGSANKRAKEGAKNLDDKGHNKHGWKNVYHREEYAQHLKFHDLYRDKNWDNSKGHERENREFNEGEKLNESLARNFYDIDKHGSKYDYTKGSQWKRQENDVAAADHQQHDGYEASQTSNNRPHREFLASGSVNRRQHNLTTSTPSSPRRNSDTGADDDGDDHNQLVDEDQAPGEGMLPDGEAVIEQMKAKLDHLSQQQQQRQQEYYLPGERLPSAQTGRDVATSVRVPTAARNIKDILKIPKASRKHNNGTRSATAGSEMTADIYSNGDYFHDGDGNDSSDGSAEMEAPPERPAAKQEDRKNELRLKLELDLGKSINHSQRSAPRARNFTITTTTMMPTQLVQNAYARSPQDHDYMAKGRAAFDSNWQQRPPANQFNGGWKPRDELVHYHSNYSGPSNRANQHHHMNQRVKQHQAAPGYRGGNSASTTTAGSNYNSHNNHSGKMAHHGEPHRTHNNKHGNSVMLNAATMAQAMPSRPIIVKHLQMNGGIVMGRLAAAAPSAFNNSSSAPYRNLGPPLGGRHFMPMMTIDHSEMSSLPPLAEDSFASSLADHDNSEILEHLPASKHPLYDLSYEPQPPFKTSAKEYVISLERERNNGNPGDQASESNQHNRLHSSGAHTNPSDSLSSSSYRRPQLDQLEQAEPTVVFEASPSERIFDHDYGQRKPSFVFAASSSSSPMSEFLETDDQLPPPLLPSDDEINESFSSAAATHHDRRPLSAIVDGIQLRPMLVRETSQHSTHPLQSQWRHMEASEDRRIRQHQQQRHRQNSFVDLLRTAPSNYSGQMFEAPPFVNTAGLLQTPINAQALIGRILRIPRVLGILQHYPAHQQFPTTTTSRSHSSLGLLSASPVYRSPSPSILVDSGGDLVGESSRLVATQVRPPPSKLAAAGGLQRTSPAGPPQQKSLRPPLMSIRSVSGQQDAWSMLTNSSLAIDQPANKLASMTKYHHNQTHKSRSSDWRHPMFANHERRFLFPPSPPTPMRMVELRLRTGGSTTNLIRQPTVRSVRSRRSRNKLSVKNLIQSKLIKQNG